MLHIESKPLTYYPTCIERAYSAYQLGQISRQAYCNVVEYYASLAE